MKLLVTGQRDFFDKIYLYRVLDDLHKMYDIDYVVHGNAKGADSLGKLWAEEKGIFVKSYPANWNLYKRAAGPIRNQEMLDNENPDVVAAFYNNKETSKGTRDMVRRSLKHPVPVVCEYVPADEAYVIYTNGVSVKYFHNVYSQLIIKQAN